MELAVLLENEQGSKAILKVCDKKNIAVFFPLKGCEDLFFSGDVARFSFLNCLDVCACVVSHTFISSGMLPRQLSI